MYDQLRKLNFLTENLSNLKSTSSRSTKLEILIVRSKSLLSKNLLLKNLLFKNLLFKNLFLCKLTLSDLKSENVICILRYILSHSFLKLVHIYLQFIFMKN